MPSAVLLRTLGYFWIFFCTTVVASADTVGFLYALEEDRNKLVSHGTGSVMTESVKGQVLHRIRIGQHDVWMAAMQSGVVSTALVTQRLVERAGCDWIISVGPAASIANEPAAKTRGSWALVEQVVPYQRGQQGVAGFVMAPILSTRPPMMDATRPLLRDLKVEGPPAALASGEWFVGNSSVREQIHRSTRAQLLDMNSLGVAQVTETQKLPLLLLRVISDYADEIAGQEFLNFAKSYDGRGGDAVGRWLKSLPPSPSTIEAHDNLRRLIDGPSK